MGSTGQPAHRPARIVGPSCAQELVRQGAVVLDVREPREWLAGHVQGARHLPLGRVARGTGDLPRDRTLIVVCRSGRRSARAAAQLAAEGFLAVNLLGGLQAWHRCGFPLYRQDGGQGRVA